MPDICQCNHYSLPYFVSVRLFQKRYCNGIASLNLKSRMKNIENNILLTSYVEKNLTG